MESLQIQEQTQVQEYCKVTLDCKLVGDFVIKRSYGIENIYEVVAEFQSTRTKKGFVYINCNDELRQQFDPNKIYFRVEGELRSLKKYDEANDKNWMYVYIVPRVVTVLDEVPTTMVNEVEFKNITVYKAPQTRLAFNNNRPTTRFVCRINRRKNVFSCIPFIVWNNLASVVMKKIFVDTVISGNGNLHSRMLNNKYIIDVCASDISITTKDSEQNIVDISEK